MDKGDQGVEKEEVIIDASALYPLLKFKGKEAVPYLKKLAILDLTKYEIGNAIWKEHKIGLVKDWKRLAKLWDEVLSVLKTYSIERVEEVESLAVKRDISFYDASYAQLAENLNLNLVTEDEELLRSCRRAVSLRKFLGMK